MPLQIRRGTDAERRAMTQPLAAGELLWITDDQRLYIGNGATLPTNLVSVTGYTNEDAQDAAASLFSGGAHNNITFTYNDATNSLSAAVNLSNYQGTIQATSFKGSVFADDSTLLVDAVDGTLRGQVIANSVIIGNEFDPGLELIEQSSTVSVIAARSSATIQITSGGVSVGNANSDNFLRVFSVGVENTATIAATTFYNGDVSNLVTFSKARGTSGTPLALINNDSIYRFRFAGHDGTAFRGSAQITGEVDGAVTTNAVPGRLNFATADSSGVMTTALQINSSQEVRPFGNLVLVNSSQTLSVNQAGQLSRVMTFTRSRGTAAAKTVAAVSDHIYTLRFSGYDGTTDQISSQIRAEIAGTPTTGAVPGRLRFLTANSAGVQTTALIINESQVVSTTSNLIVGGTIFGDLTGSIFADDSTMIVDGTNGILRGQLIGSVFADDSTMIIDGTNGNIPGYISVATLKTLASASATYADFQTAIAAL
jgi:hypothetical protein